ncbi:hypothetical protein EDM52_17215 [Brevibacillus invocatus]|uniref:Uncharacterized protein n=1 Tax=Brevibacillus invocatus TaxID=173959 RepID=A0A3M8C3T2_9BACL|nr:DUF6583 family protein [Brevibacillus invocatus]RNB70304.1 hypothetical protein EDM52_17215 [Brevibacillus invocatus]
METTTNVNPPRKSYKKTLLIIGAAAVVVIGGLGTAYAKLDLFKSSKTIYLQSEAESMMKLSSDFSKSYAEYEAYMKPYLEKPVHSKTELSDIQIDADIPDPQAEKVLDLLSSAKIIMNSNIDEQKKQQSGNLEVHLSEKKLATLEFFLNDTLVGFKLPEFYSKYAYVDLKDRETIAQNFGEELPKRFLTYGDLFKAVEVNSDEVKSIMTPYALLYANSLKDSQISMKKDVAFNEEGYQTNVREVTVSFTPEEASALLTQIAEKAKTDEKLFDLIYTRYNNMYTLMNDTGYEVGPSITREEFKKSFDQTFTDLIEDVKVEEPNKEEKLNMVVLIDSNHQILSRKLLVAEKDKESVFWQSVSYQNGADTYHRYSLQDPENADSNKLSLSYKAKEEQGKTNGTFGFLLVDESRPVMDLKTTFETTKQDKKEDGTYDFNLALQDDTALQTVSLSGKITSTTTNTDNGRESTADVTLHFDETPELPKGVSMKLKTTEEFGKPLEIPQVNDSNGINLATITEEQMMEIQQEVGISMQTFMEENAELFQEFMMMP